MFRILRSSPVVSLTIAGSLVAFLPAQAGPLAVVEKEAKEKAESRYKIYGWIDTGITFNPDSPRDNQNFGHLFTNRSNEPLLNQAVLTFQRALKPEAGKFDWGFKLQGLFGSDARIVQYLGEFNNTMNGIVQPDVLEAYLTAHLPILTESGVDVKAGQFVTLEGVEVIAAPANFFYSHTYIFNFGIPFKHTGVMVTTHATKWLDLYTGVVRGINAGFSDNNDALSFHGGLGLNLLDGKLAILASTSIGPENDAVFQTLRINTNGQSRQLHDVAITWTITDKLTALTDLNYGKDDGFDAECYGVAQYFTCAINDYLSVGVRGEIFRDDDGFFVLQSGNNEDYLKLQRGLLDNLDPRTLFGQDTTYTAVTAGVNVKLPGKLKDCLRFRPELRYDRALNNRRPFNDSSDEDQFTASIDAIASF
jgi:hypothetical protein